MLFKNQIIYWVKNELQIHSQWCFNLRMRADDSLSVGFILLHVLPICLSLHFSYAIKLLFSDFGSENITKLYFSLKVVRLAGINYYGPLWYIDWNCVTR